MNLRSRFVVLIVVVTAVLSAITIYMIRSHVRNAALDKAKMVTAGYIRAKVQEKLTLSHFSDGNFHLQKDTFQEFMNHIRTREILKIKVINSRFDIIFSTNEHDIGKKTDSINYRNALLNESVIAEIKPPLTEASNVDIYGYRQLMEIYVPVVFNGVVAGVIEVYFRMDAVNEEVFDISRYVLGLIIVFSLAIIASGYALLTFTVVRPLHVIGSAAELIAAGRPGVEIPELRMKDEIGGLASILRTVLTKAEKVSSRTKDKGKS